MGTTSSGTARVTLPSDTQILITREFDAPRRLVYKAWTTPELVRRWWAGNRGTVTSAEIDLRVGGRWRYVMAVEGGEIAFHGYYREIVPNERLVSTEVFEQPGQDQTGDQDEDAAPVTTVAFGENAGRTTLEMLTDCPSKELRDLIMASGMEVGMQEQLDVLEQLARTLD
jgi:uncharacterized protein YndB with AHSA1/START domain